MPKKSLLHHVKMKQNKEETKQRSVECIFCILQIFLGYPKSVSAFQPSYEAHGILSLLAIRNLKIIILLGFQRSVAHWYRSFFCCSSMHMFLFLRLLVSKKRLAVWLYLWNTRIQVSDPTNKCAVLYMPADVQLKWAYEVHSILLV